MTDSVDIESGSDNLRIYEAGYLLLPSIPEEKVPDEVSIIKKAIQDASATIIAEGSPALRALAYEITKHIGAKNEHYENAYFGWVKFESNPEGAIKIKSFLDGLGSILRFILIKTVRESTIQAPLDLPEEDESLEVVKKEESVSGEYLDKKIDELIAP